MSLVVYNTIKHQKEKFEPLVPGQLGIYVCGPTVYGHSHLGHAKSYISFDLIVRWFRSLGYKVRYVQNITDVGHLTDNADEGEDKISKQALLEKVEPMEVVESYTYSYFEDMDTLNVLRPNISPRASGHMIEQIEVIKGLLDKGVAYEDNGNVYFDVHCFNGYGKLSGKKLEDLEAGVRISVAEGKKHPADFALWKKADQSHLMQWPSPWGSGYPGWHLECSTMSNKYLGKTFDIHGGGLENVFPHHECEIAQAESLNEKPFARYWLHNNMVTVDGVKMGKSLGNFILLKDAFKSHHPMVIRMFVLQSHYRSPLDFSETALNATEKGWQRLESAWRLLSKLRNEQNDGHVELDLKRYSDDFSEAMNDDFNSPRAIAVLFDLIREINKTINDEQKFTRKTLDELIRFFEVYANNVLGFTFSTQDDKTGKTLDSVLEYLLHLRQDLRSNKDFKRADEIRDQLQAMGITVKDAKEGSSWEFA